MTITGNRKKKIGRNDPCPCGSGKKYKKCCLGKMPPVALSPEVLEKKQYIEKETGNEVILEVRNDIGSDALVDFPGWDDRSKLPKILHKPSIDKVHILHELIHLEKFFIDEYSIIACNDRSLHQFMGIFKNIPEDYVAHKIIKGEYNLGPIKKTWFSGKDSLNLPDREVAANLVNYHAYCNFCPEYQKRLDSFFENCRKQKKSAFLIAEEAITALAHMDYRDKDSYNQCADEFIRIFAPKHHHTSIYLSYFSKDQEQWCWNR
jgi:hypothetical protein